MKQSLTLNDLTKAELIRLIRGRWFLVEPRDLLEIRHETLCRKAHRLSKDACDRMGKSKGPANFDKWDAASRDFDRAMKIYDAADRLMERRKI